MIEGWHGDDYLILFDEAESRDFSTRYEIERYLPGHLVVGLIGWEDFILAGPEGKLLTVPAVPLDAAFLAPLAIRIDASRLERDERFAGKIRWRVQPIVFGCDPVGQDNVHLVTVADHVEFVKWWNDLYRDVRGES